MGKYGSTKNLILQALIEGEPKSAREVVSFTGVSKETVWNTLSYLWKRGLILRSEKPFFEPNKVFKGRAGIRRNTRAYYLYLLKPKGEEFVWVRGIRFVPCREDFFDVRGRRKTSKAQQIINFLKENSDKGYYSKDIVKALSDEGIKPRDIMATVRRYEKLIYIRGYKTDQRQTPFKEGYLLTWLDQEKPREEAIEEAIQRTDHVLDRRSSTNPIIERIHSIRDIIIESSKLRNLVSFVYLQNELRCSKYELEQAVKRGLQLYPDLKLVKLFNAYRYYYHTSISSEDLQAAITMKENYIRITKGKKNRIGHNWEAVPEWFIDKFTTGARFWTQEHRGRRMDPRRITIHLLKPVGRRRRNAEVDRVWEVTPGIFSDPITYVLECKWGLVRKRDVDDFFEVLRWSKKFGTDTPEGRQVKQGVIGVFAGSSFNPKESVRLKDESTISLSSYASRMNLQLLKASDFNEKLRERGVKNRVTVQKICRIAKNEKEVREVLEEIWKSPVKSYEIVDKVVKMNIEVYDFEKMLDESRR